MNWQRFFNSFSLQFLNISLSCFNTDYRFKSFTLEEIQYYHLKVLTKYLPSLQNTQKLFNTYPMKMFITKYPINIPVRCDFIKYQCKL